MSDSVRELTEEAPGWKQILRKELGSFAAFLGATGYGLLSLFALIFAWAAETGRLATTTNATIETALLVWASGACAGLAIHYAKR